MAHRPTSATTSGARPAFTVVEVLVALVLLTVGLLAIAGSSSIALRTASTAARERRAMQRSSARLAQLQAGGCAAARTDSDPDTSAGFVERWTVGTPVNGASLADAEVRWIQPGRQRVFVLRGALLC